MSSDNYDHLVQVLVIGNSNVGKTCMVQRFTLDDFSMNYLPTIAIDFKLKIFEVDGIKLKMQIWDTAGQEKFNTLTSNFFKSANGVILTYSVIDQTSFDSITKWIQQIQTFSPKNVQVLLVANKIDLKNDTIISEEQGCVIRDRVC